MRQPRLVVTLQPHNVTLHSVHARTLFSHAGDYLRFLRMAMESAQHNACDLHAFALIGRRAHLLLSPRAPLDLSNCIQVLCQRYAIARNRLTKRRGALFAQRFQSSCLADQSLSELRAQIELQPVLEGKATSPGAYPWSSANPRLGKCFAVATTA